MQGVDGLDFLLLHNHRDVILNILIIILMTRLVIITKTKNGQVFYLTKKYE